MGDYRWRSSLEVEKGLKPLNVDPKDKFSLQMLPSCSICVCNYSNVFVFDHHHHHHGISHVSLSNATLG